ncbi:RagB/SusD family nutrient uptake outer membrane protein [Chitinophaga arvensicola]|uniref:Starch-binding associating with outer membrane n=1 Tax=Chitinophaga arvensicola TaxID=29529 RepID=A0A1I0S6Z3_9BACT|nr:RagB/SusD family nutrient uptake outer membrane protein [Chitinophaga arvensicola]SEW51497.1 Starch-binding associating with outer membrane [Chitinophaga arvensicola]
MKKIILIAIAFASFTSCQQSLTEEPKSFLSPEQFFKSDQDAIQGVNGAYYWLVGSYPNRLFQQELWSVLDENCDVIRSPHPGPLNLTAGSPGSAPVMYSGLYKGIYAANLVIDKVTKSPGISPETKKRVLGEAKFLRALFYYYLTGLFGDAVLYTESNYANIDASKTFPRTPVADIRKQMIADLTEAAAGLPATYTIADKGRATSGAALALLTKVYLWTKDFPKAEETALKIKTAGNYILLDDYASVFSASNEFNKESIFEIDFQTDLLNSYQHAFYSPNNTVGVEPFKSKPWYRSYVPYHTFANSFDPKDKRKAAIIATGYNGQAFAPDATNKVDVWFGPKWWRLDAGERNSGLDIYLLRYADVLLMLAEAANENGHNDVAFGALNEVRKRAGLDDAAGLSQDQFRNEIYQERAWELCGEGHRRFDLARWGKYPQAAVTASATEEPELSASYKPYYVLLPIPATEVQKNPALGQNTGY